MKRILQLVIILIPFILFGWLLIKDIAPSGEKTVVYMVGDNSPYIKPMRPNDRILPLQKDSNGVKFITIIDDPVYFSVHSPQTEFETIEVTTVFDPNDQPILEVGALHDVFAQSFDLRPLYNEQLASLEWPYFEENGVRVYQRNTSYISLDEFWLSSPSRDSIATYHYSLEEPYRIADYVPLGSRRSLDFSLRGHHKFFTYVKDEVLDLELTYMDMNRKPGEDEVRIIVRNENGEEVAKHIIADDGNIDENQLSTTETVAIQVPALPEGVYSVELSTTSDVFWRNLKTNLRYVTFSQIIHLGDTVGHLPEPIGVNFVTNAKHFVFETLHAESLQQINLGTEEAVIERTHEKVRTSINQEGIIFGYSPVGDVKIVGDGKFAFGQDMFFDPDPVQLSVLTDINQREIDYIFTTYEASDSDAVWKEVSHEFILDDILNEEGIATFVFSAPLIAEMQNTARIQKIIVTYKKDPMNFRELMHAIRDRIPFGI